MKNKDSFTFSARLEEDNQRINLYYKHIKLPKKVYEYFLEKKIKRLMCSINENRAFHAGIMPIGDGTYFIIASKKLMKDHQLQVGDLLNMEVWEDTSKYGMYICPEMEELLHQDPVGDKYFHQLTDGKIRSLLHKVNSYKSANKRLEKGVIILEHLKVNKGKLNWKLLNEAFKQSF